MLIIVMFLVDRKVLLFENKKFKKKEEKK